MDSLFKNIVVVVVLVVVLVGIVFGVHSCNADVCASDVLRYGAISHRHTINGCVLEIEEGVWINRYYAEEWFVFKALGER